MLRTCPNITLAVERDVKPHFDSDFALVNLNQSTGLIEWSTGSISKTDVMVDASSALLTINMKNEN